MNEQDFRSALHQSMAAQPAPPPMSDVPVLAAARRDRRRRRALLAGTGSAVAVAAIVVGVAVLAPSGGNPRPVQVGGGPKPTSTSVNVPTNAPKNSDTGFPEGMTDRTARSGPQYDRGVALAGELAGVIPPGYESPADLVGAGMLAGVPLTRNQAQYADTVNNVDLWEYEAIAPVTKGDGVGQLVVEVHTPGNTVTGNGCAMSPAFWGETGTCEEVRVDGKAVAVVTTNGERLGQWAGYRHADGTVVYIAQSKVYANAGLPALDGLPFTSQRLAALAADPRFDVA